MFYSTVQVLPSSSNILFFFAANSLQNKGLIIVLLICLGKTSIQILYFLRIINNYAYAKFCNVNCRLTVLVFWKTIGQPFKKNLHSQRIGPLRGGGESIFPSQPNFFSPKSSVSGLNMSVKAWGGGFAKGLSGHVHKEFFFGWLLKYAQYKNTKKFSNYKFQHSLVVNQYEHVRLGPDIQ